MFIPAAIPRSWTSSCHWWRRKSWTYPRLGRTRARGSQDRKAEGAPSPCECVLHQLSGASCIFGVTNVGYGRKFKERLQYLIIIIFILRLLVQWVILVVSCNWLKEETDFYSFRQYSFIRSALFGVLMWLVSINCPVIGQNKLSCVSSEETTGGPKNGRF
jgi:hypothetical protein